MARPEPHEPEKLTRYACGNLSLEEQGKLEKHIRGCAPCRDYVSFVREFNAGVREAKPPKPTADEPCPDTALLVDLEAGELDERTASHVRAHLLFCGDCREIFYALRRSTRKATWQDVVEKLKGVVVDLSKRYGPGALIGSVKIVSEQFALARRGEGAAEALTKAFELAVGENNYNVEVRFSADGALHCSVAGYKPPVWAPLQVAVCTEAGDEVFCVQTDKQGNTQFDLGPDAVPDGVYMFVLTLGDDESYLPLRVPKGALAA